MATEVQYDLNPQDWSTFDTSIVLDAGYALWFYNNDAFGSDVRFNVIGDGSTTIEDLDKFLPQPADSNTVLYTRPSTLGYAADCKLVGVTVEGDDTVRFLIDFGCYAKQDASTITLTGTTENYFQVSVGEYNSGNVNAASGSFSDVTVEGRLVFCRFTLTSSFSGLTAFRGGNFTSVSTGLHFTLS